MSYLRFDKMTIDNIDCYVHANISIVQDLADSQWYIRIRENGVWNYPSWEHPSFNTVQAATKWLSTKDLDTITSSSISMNRDIQDVTKILGFNEVADGEYLHCDDDPKMTLSIAASGFRLDYLGTYQFIYSCTALIRVVEGLIKAHGRQLGGEIPVAPVMAAINTRNLAQNIVRVKSSNVWGYTINVKDRKSKFGDVIVQFKGNNGGPGDIYIYYDVPVLTYRRWHSAPSKGHYFWVYIRNNFKYSKLTGDKRGKLHNAVN